MRRSTFGLLLFLVFALGTAAGLALALGLLPRTHLGHRALE